MNEPTKNFRRIRIRLWCETCIAITLGRQLSLLNPYLPQGNLF